MQRATSFQYATRHLTRKGKKGGIDCEKFYWRELKGLCNKKQQNLSRRTHFQPFFRCTLGFAQQGNHAGAMSEHNRFYLNLGIHSLLRDESMAPSYLCFGGL